MPTITVNNLRLQLLAAGEGEPVVFVHGSWGDHHSWDALVAELPDGLRAIRYARRGHSGSECPPGQGSIEEDVADLAAVIETAAGGRAHVVGSSLGAQIALRLALGRPELVRSLALHEPPFWGLVPDEPSVRAIEERIEPARQALEAGAWEDGARLFADEVFGAGAWDTAMPDALKAVMVANAPTFLDEERAKDTHSLDTTRLATLGAPTLLSTGDQSPQAFHAVAERLAAELPHAQRESIAGAGHVPHRSHPQEYAALLAGFWARLDSPVAEQALELR